ncbi:nitric oxide reductase activation protein NorD [Methylibium sp.]|uniref:nitric oxide reductase activation protein NorD n=1 Tax=Methylibium sp. TaxID=2067992 RepID=UPI003D101BDD
MNGPAPAAAASRPAWPDATAAAAAPPALALAALRAELAPYLRTLWRTAPPLATGAPGPQAAPPCRPWLSLQGVHLPAAVALAAHDGADEAQARDWYRAAATHAAAHRAYASQPLSRAGSGPVVQALVGLLEDARVEHLACRELPGLRRLWLRFHDAGPALGDGFEALMRRLARSLLDPGYGDPHPWVAKGRRLFFLDDHGQVLAVPHTAALRTLAARLGHDIGQLRAGFNARDYLVQPSYRDDNSWLWLPEQERAAPEAAAPRPDETPVPAGPAPDRERVPAAAARYSYPEWDRLIARHRPGWCTVIETRPLAPPGLPPGHEAHSSPPREVFALLTRDALAPAESRGPPQPRAAAPPARGGQLDGDEFDLDALTQAATASRAGLPPDDRVHRRRARAAGRRASLWLIDASASSAGPARGAAGGMGTGAGDSVSLLRAARAAAWQAACGTQGPRHACAIHGFCSEGRGAVHYRRLKDFDDALDADAAARLGALSSGLSTRLGAALRHATALLRRQRATHRTLVLVSDGEPHDIDTHDPRYLIDDARRAVQAAARRGITVRCVGLDPAAAPALRRIFGAGGYSLPAHPGALTAALARAAADC